MARVEGIFRFGRAAFRIAAWTLLSRVLGLVRDRLMFGTFGRGPALGAFHLAWTVPNTFRRLLGEGALAASFVPVLTQRLDEDGVARARRSVAAVLGALLAVLAGILVLGWAGVEALPEAWLAGGEAAGEDYARLLRTLLAILLPYVLPICLLTVAAGAQNVTGRFALPAAAPALLNAVWIGAVVVAASLEVDSRTRIVVVGACVLAGGWLQLLLQLPGLARSGLLAAPRLAFGDPDLRRVARNMLPMVAGLSVVQLNTVATQVLAAFLVDRGAPSILFLANRMLEFPHALLGVALGTAAFPLLSLLGGRGDAAGLRATLDRALSLGLFLALPAAAGLFVLAPPLIDVLFVTGRFTAGAGAEATLVLRVLSLALPGLICVQILARAHYALGDMRTPVRIAVVLFFLAQAMNVGLAPRFGTAGLACSSAFSATANALLLLVSLRRRVPPQHRRGRVAASFARSVIASAPTAAAAWWTAGALAGAVQSSGFVVRVAVVLVCPAIAGVAVFLGVAKVAGAPEVGEILAALRRRSGISRSSSAPPP